MKREWLVYAREKRNLTQKEMGKRMFISESYYNMIEKGKRKKNLDLETTKQLSMILGIGMEQILAAEDRIKTLELLGLGN